MITMIHKHDYKECKNALEFLMRIGQNAMICFLQDENITQTLEMGKHINHTPLRKSLTCNSILKVARAFFEMHRYFLCTEKNNFKFLHMFLEEGKHAITVYGEEIHQKEKLLHDRKFTKSVNTL